MNLQWLYYFSVIAEEEHFTKAADKIHVSQSSLSHAMKDMEDEFFRLLEGETDARQIRLIHGIIWLSLTTYAWDNYDAVCGAFYNGTYYLEEAL